MRKCSGVRFVAVHIDPAGRLFKRFERSASGGGGQEIRHVRSQHSISASAKWPIRSARRRCRFSDDKIAPIAAEIDETDEFPRQLWPQMGEAGLHGITVEEEWGGLGLGYLEHVVAQEEEVARGSASVGLSYGAQSNLCVDQIRRWANPEQKQQISPQADQRRACRRAGDERGGRGQRRRRHEAQGRASGNGYRLNGTKFWITNGRMRTRSSSMPRPARAAAASPPS